MIDEVRVYHQVLTPSQIQVLAGQVGPSQVGPSQIDEVFAKGDTNLDGKVDFAEFLVLANNFGRSSRDFGSSDGDLDENGTVDFVDFLTLSQNFDRA